MRVRMEKRVGGRGEAKIAEFRASSRRKGLSVLEDENGLFLESRGVGERVTGWSRPGHCRGFGFDLSSDGMPLKELPQFPERLRGLSVEK